MATIQSLGLHEPSGLSYLLNESIIQPDSQEDQYKWVVNTVYDKDKGSVEEEILTTKTCVLWSRDGVLKRVFRLEQEEETIIQAVVTCFPFTEIRKSSSNAISGNSGQDHTFRGPSKPSLNGKVKKKREAAALNAANPFSKAGSHESDQISNGDVSTRALVVILKTQAHIYFLSGDFHIVHMPFVAASALATPHGLILQRKIGKSLGSTHLAPPNSMASSHANNSVFQASQSFTMASGVGNRPTLNIPPAQQGRAELFPKSSSHRFLPRVFTLTDPMSEIGLVATAPVSHNLTISHSDGGYNLLDPSEEILYISVTDEWSSEAAGIPSPSPLILVVTMNKDNAMYTIWTAKFRSHDGLVAAKRRKSLSTGGTSRRKSSRGLGIGTGATTPAVAGHSGLRESMDGNGWGPHVGNPSLEDRKIDPTNDLASQLGPEFEDAGVSLKTSRRVSSLLARADLAATNDRTTFSELVSGNSIAAGAHTGNRRGASAGQYTGRTSFGVGIMPHRRSSVFGESSFLSNGTSNAENPVDHLLDELNNGGDFDGFENVGLTENMQSLTRELLLTRIESFSSSVTRPPQAKSVRDEILHPEIFTLRSSLDTSQDAEIKMVWICIPEPEQKRLFVASLRIQRHAVAKHETSGSRTGSEPESDTFVVKATTIQQGADIIDACKLYDGNTTRMLLMTKKMDGAVSLALQAPWSTPVNVDLPPKFMVYDPYNIAPVALAARRRDGGLKRVISDMSKNFIALQHSTENGRFDLVDENLKRHRLEIRMEPRSMAVRDVLDICNSILYSAGKPNESILVTWWHVLRWLNTKPEIEINLEWTAFVISLFTLAVMFIKETNTRAPVKQKRRTSKLLRSSSGSSVDLEDWESMLDQESGSGGTTSSWMTSQGWNWTLEQTSSASMNQTRMNSKPRGALSGSSTAGRPPTTRAKNAYILRCSSLAREFLASAASKDTSGGHGYLPSVIGKDSQSEQTSLGALIIGLHLYREEKKLDTSMSEGCRSETVLLAPVLGQIGSWLGWQSWGWKGIGYYGLEMADMDQWLFEESRISLIPTPAEPFPPPSIFEFIEDRLKHGKQSGFLTVVDLISNLAGSNQRPILESKLWKEIAALTPRTFALTGYLSQVESLTTATEKVEHMMAWGLTPEVVESFPEGVSSPFHEIIAACQANPPSSWSTKLLALIDREDLSMSMSRDLIHATHSRSQMALVHEAFRDVHTIGTSTLETESMTAFDASAEADRSSVTKLIFKDDRRYVEAAKLVNQMRPPIAECQPEPEWTESELLDAQKGLVQLVTIRTLAVSSGRGMIHYSARVPLLTEKLPIPGFTLQCIMRPSNVTFSAERSAFSEEKVCWAFFHAGASTGLAISKAAKGIDTSWVLYNKPAELNNRHAGFLLALGLNGHLKTLAKWVAFKYLTPKHTMTSIGLLLGLSASYLGTMDTLITRLLSVHVTRMLPQGAAELNLSPMTQTTGIMGIGLLYCSSQHRRMSEVMLSEIENIDQEEVSPPQEILRDEGYRLAAGFALGLINLGKGKDLRGLHDMHLVERLLSLAIGTKNVNIVHILDRATAGAVVAIAIIFMKTHDEVLAAKIDIPDTIHQFDYVRPDIFLLRTVARHLIMWDSICATFAWVEKSLPKAYQRRYRLTSIRRLSSEDLPFFNIIAGLCFSIGLRFAGSGSTSVRDLLVFYLDQFIRICKLPALNYDGKLTRDSARNCQDIVALSAASVVAGTGDLDVFRRLRFLHGRVDADTTYGSHLATHMAIGALFLGGGCYTFGTSNRAIASLLCAFYPLFPTSVLDNKCHLQAFRHLWVLAAEPRCLVPRDVESHRPVSIPISLTLRDGSRREATVPSLLPELRSIASIEVTSPDYWPLTIDFISNTDHLLSFQQNQSIYVRRRTAYDTPGASAFHATLHALSDAQPVSHLSSNPTGGIFLPPWITTASKLPFDWIFNCPSLAGLDMAERALVSPPYHITSHQSSGSRFLRPTVVDTRLMLERTSVGGGWTMGVRDQLWQLRLLFAWVDGMDRKAPTAAAGAGDTDGSTREVDGSRASGLWLRMEFVEELRWKVWCLASASAGTEIVLATA